MMTSPVTPILLSYPTSLTGKKKRRRPRETAFFGKEGQNQGTSLFKDAGYS